jgi:hypothetical protein
MWDSLISQASMEILLVSEQLYISTLDFILVQIKRMHEKSSLGRSYTKIVCPILPPDINSSFFHGISTTSPLLNLTLLRGFCSEVSI